jgi:tetratricopeptide (TPR) repeat protein
VQQAATQLHVTINLLSADGGRIINGAIYDDSFENIFELQRRIAEQLTKLIVGTLSSATEQRLARVPTNNVRALAAYWRGRDYLDNPGPEPIERAIAAFGESVHIDPSFAIGYAGLGSAYWHKYAETHEAAWARKAVEETERARQIDPNESEVRYALATVYRGIGRIDNAVSELKQVFELQPNHEAAHRTLGDIYASRQRIQDAVDEYEEALRIRPDYWGTYRALGVLYWRAGRYPEALAAFDRIIELQPDSPYGYQLRGTVHGTMHDLPRATADYEAALDRGGTPATNSALGTVYYLPRRFDDAARSYEKAIAQRPNGADTHWNLADAYRHLGRTADARTEYERAVRLYDADLAVNPKDAPSIATRATCLARLGRVGEAVDGSARAVQLAPATADVLYQRALVLTIAGRKDEAIGALEQAVAGGYSVQLLRTDVDLSSLHGSRRFQALVGNSTSTSGRIR